jgi:hypothetical protein
LAGCLAGGVLVLGCSHDQRPALYKAPQAAIVTPAAPVAAAVETPPAPVTPIAQPVVKQESPAIQPVKFRVGEDAVPRRSYADITAKPCYAHDAAYHVLSGELQFVHVRNAWRLRYASVDEEDRYGGSVTLTEMGSMDGFANGQFVRVEGCLADPQSNEPSPAFRVRTIQRLSQP